MSLDRVLSSVDSVTHVLIQLESCSLQSPEGATRESSLQGSQVSLEISSAHKLVAYDRKH